MRFSTSAVVLAFALSVSAQTTHNITVGMGGKTYSPANITAELGDLVSFIFVAGNHTMSQSTFADPCTQFTNTSVSDPTLQNLTSGFREVNASSDGFPQFTIQITQTAPIWFFCAQTGHCESGMVGSINAVETGDKSFEAFKAKATGIAATNSTTPTGTGSGKTETGSDKTSSPTSSSTTKPSNAAVSGKRVGGTVSLGVVGIALGLML